MECSRTAIGHIKAQRPIGLITDSTCATSFLGRGIACGQHRHGRWLRREKISSIASFRRILRSRNVLSIEYDLARPANRLMSPGPGGLVHATAQ